jgi:hypothetical protein
VENTFFSVSICFVTYLFCIKRCAFHLKNPPPIHPHSPPFSSFGLCTQILCSQTGCFCLQTLLYCFEHIQYIFLTQKTCKKTPQMCFKTGSDCRKVVVYLVPRPLRADDPPAAFSAGAAPADAAASPAAAAAAFAAAAAAFAAAALLAVAFLGAASLAGVPARLREGVGERDRGQKRERGEKGGAGEQESQQKGKSEGARGS